MKKVLFRCAMALVVIFLYAGWGAEGHKIINKNITNSFPAQMSMFKYWSDSLTAHASDADNRKSQDKTESPKHFIDIDYYAEFVANHRIPQTLDSMNAKYGASTVTTQGILPFAIVATVDSIRAAFLRRDFSRAMLVSADLGHYIGDGHQPLHVTQNYDGAMTNQSGVHSRYETTMIGAYKTIISYTCDTAQYISDVTNFAFQAVYKTNSYVDSVLRADSMAKATTGSTSGTAYTTYMWNATGQFTTQLMKEASWQIASLIYTAWVDAGSPKLVTDVKNDILPTGKKYSVSAYPNPFNGQVTFSFSAPQQGISGSTALVIYDVTGREIDRVNDIVVHDGSSVRYTANRLSSGTYFACLQSANQVLSAVKFVLMK